jgi:hypothetical protein
MADSTNLVCDWSLDREKRRKEMANNHGGHLKKLWKSPPSNHSDKLVWNLNIVQNKNWERNKAWGEENLSPRSPHQFQGRENRQAASHNSQFSFMLISCFWMCFHYNVILMCWSQLRYTPTCIFLDNFYRHYLMDLLNTQEKNVISFCCLFLREENWVPH